MSNILVTGGAGAIGSNLVKKLIELDNKVVIIDDTSSGNLNNLVDVEDSISVVQGSIVNESCINEAFSYDIDEVYHLAVNFANQNSVDNPEKDLMTNGIGTVKILEASVQHKVKKFLLSSSSCVYRPADKPFAEKDDIELTTPYAITKMLSEYYVSFFSKFHNLPSVMVRYFNNYGPGDVPGQFRGVVPNFMYKAMNNEPLPITGDGSETRPFTFVDDIVSGTIKAMDNGTRISPSFSGHPLKSDNNIVYNIGSDKSYTILEFAETLNKVCGNSAGIEFLPKRNWDMFPKRAVNNDKAREELDFDITHDLTQGLTITYDWFKKQNFKL
tara:strand:- start:3932 stop:4915 length:984 start_codon:yes stop_codon:yes gene_type:complete